MENLSHTAMYLISNDTKEKLENLLRYFAQGKGIDTRDVNRRRVAGLLASKLGKTKKSESK